MNTYIKQLIDAYGNNLVPVSGTASCYNSEGKNVDELLENLKSELQILVPITWAELNALKSSKSLTPGTIYQITDYKTVSSQAGTSTTGTTMPILIQAISKNMLSEDGIALFSSGSGGGGGGQDISSGTVTVKKLLMGDDRDEDDPGVWMIDHGTAVYLFHDMYEFAGSTYYRWMKYNPYGENWSYPDFYSPTQNQGKSRPIYILTSTDEWDFSDGQHYEPDFCITFDDDTEETEDYIIDKEIMGMEEVTVPLMLFADKFAEDGYPESLYDTGFFFVYVDSIDLDGVTYYRWAECYSGDQSPTFDSDMNYLLTDTLDLTFDGTQYYSPSGFMTIDNEAAEDDGYGNDASVIRILDTNYKSAFGGSEAGGSVELVEVKYSLDNNRAKYIWSGLDTASIEVHTDDNAWFTMTGTITLNGTDYYKWYSAKFCDENGENALLLSTTLSLSVGDSLDYVSDYTDPENIDSEYSTIDNIKVNEKGYGVIYYMKDTNNNQAPYDFKNILFSDHYTFDLNGSDYSSSSYCYENTIKPYYNRGIQYLNNVVFKNINQDEYCKANYIEPDTHDLEYGPGTSDLDTRLILGEY